VRQRVALVRDVELLDGSILENVQLDRFEVTRHAVRRALYVSGLLQHVLALPEGIHTPLAAAQLTPQQEKQLLLARALAGQPGLLVIDGLLDQFSGRALREAQQRLGETTQAPTIIILTNRTEIADQCHKQLVVNRGEGSHEPTGTEGVG